jgi:hypothetical protein
VRNGVSREPEKNALVVLEELPSSDAPASSPPEGAKQPQTRAALTGPAGEFHFEGWSNGQYACFASKPGYAAGSLTFVLPASQESDGIEIALAPLGAIEGHVVNQYDEPVENVVLDIYQSTIFDGETRVASVGTAWTDDLGSYHLAYLAPGKYYVKAKARRGGTVTHSGINTMRYGPWESFTPRYYGGVADLTSATPITVTAGARVRADFHLDMQPSFRVRGKVHGYVAPGAVTFELVQNDDRTEPSRALLNVTTGEFEILDVPPGSHKLRAVQEGNRGEVTVQVGENDVSGVIIALLPPLTINVSVRSVAGEDRSTPRAYCEVILFPQQPVDAIYSSVVGNGEPTISGLFPGEYRVHFRCYGAYLQAASFGGADLLENPVIKISSGATLPPIEVGYKQGGGTLHVTFATQLSRHGAVLVVPDFSPSAGPVLDYSPGAARGGQQLGEELITNLAPGDYLVYGLAQYEAEFRNPAFLQALSAGTRVHIEDGKTAEVTIASVSQ